MGKYNCHEAMHPPGKAHCGSLLCQWTMEVLCVCVFSILSRLGRMFLFVNLSLHPPCATLHQLSDKPSPLCLTQVSELKKVITFCLHFFLKPGVSVWFV